MTTAPKQRFLALDVFRGMTICFMIIVNTSGVSLRILPLNMHIGMGSRQLISFSFFSLLLLEMP
jgi:predicted acyltransferase